MFGLLKKVKEIEIVFTPQGAKYVAKDENDKVYFFETKPVIDEKTKGWVHLNGQPVLSPAYDVKIEGDWKDSLRKIKKQ